MHGFEPFEIEVKFSVIRLNRECFPGEACVICGKSKNHQPLTFTLRLKKIWECAVAQFEK